MQFQWSALPTNSAQVFFLISQIFLHSCKQNSAVTLCQCCSTRQPKQLEGRKPISTVSSQRVLFSHVQLQSSFIKENVKKVKTEKQTPAGGWFQGQSVVSSALYLQREQSVQPRAALSRGGPDGGSQQQDFFSITVMPVAVQRRCHPVTRRICGF